MPRARRHRNRDGSVHGRDLLAMANAPDFDPNHFGSSAPTRGAIAPSMDAYEPGSTFKLITAAAALESGKVNDADRASRRAIRSRSAGERSTTPKTASWPARRHRDARRHRRILAQRRRGRSRHAHRRADALRDDPRVRLRRLHTRVGIAAARTPVSCRRSDEWSGSSLATISFGHGISTTPIALARSYAAIANGGLLMRPRIVHAIFEDAAATSSTPTRREVERRVISEANGGEAAPVLARGRRWRHGQSERAGRRAIRPPEKPARRKWSKTAATSPASTSASFIGYVPAERRAT